MPRAVIGIQHLSVTARGNASREKVAERHDARHPGHEIGTSFAHGVTEHKGRLARPLAVLVDVMAIGQPEYPRWRRCHVQAERYRQAGLPVSALSRLDLG